MRPKYVVEIFRIVVYINGATDLVLRRVSEGNASLQARFIPSNEDREIQRDLEVFSQSIWRRRK